MSGEFETDICNIVVDLIDYPVGKDDRAFPTMSHEMCQGDFSIRVLHGNCEAYESGIRATRSLIDRYIVRRLHRLRML